MQAKLLGLLGMYHSLVQQCAQKAYNNMLNFSNDMTARTGFDYVPFVFSAFAPADFLKSNKSVPSLLCLVVSRRE